MKWVLQRILQEIKKKIIRCLVDESCVPATQQTSLIFWRYVVGSSVWCIKNHTKHSSKTLMSLVWFLMHQKFLTWLKIPWPKSVYLNYFGIQLKTLYLQIHTPWGCLFRGFAVYVLTLCSIWNANTIWFLWKKGMIISFATYFW